MGCPFHFGAAKTPAAPQPLSVELKTGTRPMHDRAESHPVQQAILSRDAQAARRAHVPMLAQMHAVHAVLEPVLKHLAATAEPFRSLIRPYHFRLGLLCDDLAFFDVTAEELRPTPGAIAFRDAIAAAALTRPSALLGVFYVLEGSTNGGTIIGKSLRTTLNLPAGKGTAYTDPHGPSVRQRWGEFKTGLDAAAFDSADRTAILSLAADSFDHVRRIMDDVWTIAEPRAVTIAGIGA